MEDAKLEIYYQDHREKYEYATQPIQRGHQEHYGKHKEQLEQPVGTLSNSTTLAGQSLPTKGQGDQCRGNKATKSEIRAEFKKRHKPDGYTWNQVAHWVDMVPFDAAERDGSQQSPTQQGDATPAGGDKETSYHRERSGNAMKREKGEIYVTNAQQRVARRSQEEKQQPMWGRRQTQRRENNMEADPDQSQQEVLASLKRGTGRFEIAVHEADRDQFEGWGAADTPQPQPQHNNEHEQQQHAPEGDEEGVAYNNLDYYAFLGQLAGIAKQKPGQGGGTGAETSPTAAITAGRGELRRINPAQMAATLVEVVRHILRDTLHATSVRTELSEVGELLEDVVADFGASIRLRDSEGIAEGRDALMEAVDILDQIVMNYDTEHDEFTMDPATLQDDLLRLAQQLQIVVPAHNNLMGDIRGELPSQRPSCNSQELFEGYGDEMGLMQQLVGERGEHHIQRPQTWTDLLRQIRGELNNMPLQCRHACVHQLLCRLHRPGPDPAGDTEEGHRCALQLLFEHEFPESYRTNGQCEADAIWLLLRGERLGEYIDGMNLPAEERVRGGQEDEHPGLRGGYQHHEGNARDGAMGRHTTPDEDSRRDQNHHPEDYEPTALMQFSLRGRSTGDDPGTLPTRDTSCTTTTTTTTPQQGEDPARPTTPATPARSRSPSRRGDNRTTTTTGGERQTPSPIRRARSQASQLLASITSETQAAAEYAPNAEELGRQRRADAAAEALDLITEAMGMANDVGMPGVVDYLSAAATRLSQLHLIRRPGTNRGGRPLPTPNAFEIAALTVGVMEESAQQGEPPSMAEMLELLELVQAGMALET
ncbi:unnamed protein product [Symbiodinium necroappetens]|uniref:Uncharacterized protein n=1 Tax=Symbiodinium necroappetens TaxID=1628268 RepID=A0A812KBM0_9DINO|nr:unnamed protein product [Symbiodinium necroappetens]